MSSPEISPGWNLGFQLCRNTYHGPLKKSQWEGVLMKTKISPPRRAFPSTLEAFVLMRQALRKCLTTATIFLLPRLSWVLWGRRGGLPFVDKNEAFCGSVSTPPTPFKSAKRCFFFPPGGHVLCYHMARHSLAALQHHNLQLRVLRLLQMRLSTLSTCDGSKIKKWDLLGVASRSRILYHIALLSP